MQISKYLQPFFENFQQTQLNRERMAEQQEREDFNRAFALQNQNLRALELKRLLDRQQLSDAVEALKLSGRTDKAGYEQLKNSPFAPIVESTEAAQSPTPGPWGKLPIDTGGQGPQYKLVKSPEARQEEYDKQISRQLLIDQRDMMNDDRRRRSQLPGLIAEVMQRNPKAGPREILPAIAGSADPNQVLSYLREIALEESRSDASNRAWATVNRLANPKPKPPTPSALFTKQRMDDLNSTVNFLMSGVEKDIEKEGGLMPYIQGLRQDFENDAFPYSSDVYDAFMAALARKFGGAR